MSGPVDLSEFVEALHQRCGANYDEDAVEALRPELEELLRLRAEVELQRDALAVYVPISDELAELLQDIIPAEVPDEPVVMLQVRTADIADGIRALECHKRVVTNSGAAS